MVVRIKCTVSSWNQKIYWYCLLILHPRLLLQELHLHKWGCSWDNLPCHDPGCRQRKHRCSFMHRVRSSSGSSANCSGIGVTVGPRWGVLFEGLGVVRLLTPFDLTVVLTFLGVVRLTVLIVGSDEVYYWGDSAVSLRRCVRNRWSVASNRYAIFSVSLRVVGFRPPANFAR